MKLYKEAARLAEGVKETLYEHFIDKLLSFTYFEISMAILQSREIPLGPRKKATAIHIRQMTALTRS